jgi:hypothetical protein
VDHQPVYIVPPTKTLTIDKEFEKIYMPSHDAYYAYFYCDQYSPGLTETPDGYTEPSYAFEVTSSNPKIAGVDGIWPMGDGYYMVQFTTGQPGVKGNAKITIKAADNGKSASFTVYVDDKYDSPWADPEPVG